MNDYTPFTILEHTADVGLQIEGGDEEELFVNAGKGFFSLLTPLEQIRPLHEVRLQAEGLDPEELLVSWLGELLYQFSAKGWLFCDFVIEELSEESVEAIARGEPFEEGRHDLSTEIKAVTYHNLELVCLDDERWQARVFFDL